VESEDMLISNMIYTNGIDLTARKQVLLDNGDGVLILPGGVGTLDELWDSVCGKSLKMKGWLVYSKFLLSYYN
jgi:predicted Rossmann-fold nucleotide-binding protein